MAYLYGASIKGIQGYIFRSNVLKEIVGASEIIKNIESMVKAKNGSDSPIKKRYGLKENPKVLLSAAGNIRLRIESEDDAKKIVLDFTKDIMQMAYGITVVQAVEHVTGTLQDHRFELEQKLNIQRNKVTLPLDMSHTILKLDPKSSRPIYAEEIKGVGEDIYRDMSTFQKINAYNKIPEEKRKNVEFSDISNDDNKIAIVHADGNGLGKIVKNFKGDILSLFSEQLDKATHEAFKKAIESFGNIDIKEREVILGGDDMTMVCNADYALEFTQRYLELFEEETKKKDKIPGSLTACAGIAYCQEKLPFHHAVALAEELCVHAKQHAKQINPDLAPSCLMFYNTKEAEQISYKETIRKAKKVSGVSFDFGPYYINTIKKEGKKQPTVEALIQLYRVLNTEDGVISKFREAVDELYKDGSLWERMVSDMASKFSYSGKDYSKELSALYEGLTMKNFKVLKDDTQTEKTPLIDLLELKNVMGDRGFVLTGNTSEEAL
jgi:hypothetical protein